MNKFLSTLSPNYIPPELINSDDLGVIRERILQLMFLGAAVVGLFFYASNLYLAITEGSYYLIAIYTLIYAGVIVSVSVRKLPFRVRSITLLILLFGVGLIGLLQYGLFGSGRIFLLTFSIMATLLLGLGAGSAAAFLSIITLIFSAILKTSNNPLMTSAEVTVSAQGANWVSAIFAFIFVNSVVIGSTQLIMLNLQRIIALHKKITDELQEEQTKLSSEIERRTNELSSRANQLETANEIAQVIAQETDLDRLCSSVVNQITDRLNYYYASVFLLDDRKEYAVMQAGTGEAGKALLARKHSLKVGEIGMVGFVVSRGEIKIAQNVRLEPVHYKNPLLPDTMSEIAIPLIARGQIIGALDVQSTVEDAFSPETVTTIQAIADQLATSLDRAQLLIRLQETTTQMEVGYKQFTETAWRSFLKSNQGSRAFRYNRASVEPQPMIRPEVESLIREGIQQPVRLSAKGQEDNRTITALAIPVMLRNQILGVIDVRFEGEKISKETLSLLESASARLAVALESARLLEESQSRANREHLVTDISARVRSSTEVNGILQTAAQELGRVLGVSEVMVQLRSSSDE